MTAILAAAATLLRSSDHVAPGAFASREALAALPLSGGVIASTATIPGRVSTAAGRATYPVLSTSYHYRHAGAANESLSWFARLTCEPDLGGQYIQDPRDVHRWRSGALLPDEELLERPVMH